MLQARDSEPLGGQGADRLPRLVADQAPVLLAYCDTEGRYRYVNRAYAERFGQSADDVIGRTIREVLGDAGFAAIRPHVEAALQGRRVEFEVEVPYAQIGPRVVQCSYAPERGPDGAVVGFIAAITDVTERRRAEEALRSSERFTKHVLDSSRDCIKVLDLEGHLLYMSPGGQSLLEIADLTTVLGRRWIDFWHGPDHAAARQAVAAAAAGGVGSFEGFCATEGGRPKWWDVVVTPILGAAGRPESLLAISRDVTERRRMAEALEHREQHLRAIIQTTPECVKVVAEDGTLVEMNAAGLQMVEAERPESVIGSCTFDLVAPEHREAFVAFHRQVCGGEAATLEFEIVGLRGTRRVMETHAVPLRRADGSTMQLAITRDVTARKQAEAALRENARQKDEFLAVLAHELRNPLAPIRTALELMRLAPGDAGVRERTQAVLERQVAQLVRLVDDLLDVSRITRGKIELRKEIVPLSTVLQSAVETARPLIEAKGHRLTVSAPAEEIPVDADPTRLAQVFSNLLSNAAKYTEPGGGIEMTVETRDGEVCVQVRDNGIGIPPEMLPHVFEMFTQLDSALERSHGGLGIGLTLAKRLVSLHGGTIEARSDGPGCGSEFAVRLPAAVTPAGEPVPPARAARRVAPHRILIVDDNRDAAETLAHALRTLGHEVETAFDGFAALDRFAAYQPQVVLLDIGMPGMNGLDVGRRLHAQAGSAPPVIVALTGWGQESDRRRSLDAGFHYHLVKPVDIDALEQLLAALPERS